jgi:integrase
MARRHKGPWQRKSGDKGWYTSIDGRHVKIGNAEDDFKTIQQRYHEVHAGNNGDGSPATVHRLVSEFLAWNRVNRSSGTVDWYAGYLTTERKGKKPFVATVPATLRAVDLKPHQVTRWADRYYGDDSDSTRHGAYRSITRAYNWAMKCGMITRNPLVGIEKPTPTIAEIVITQEQFDDLLKRTKDQAFKDVLVFAWETGARAYEIRTLQTHHFDGEKFTLEKKNSKGKKYNRVILLTPVALEIAKRRIGPGGHVFRSRSNEAWKKAGITSRFRRLREATGSRIASITATPAK